MSTNKSPKRRRAGEPVYRQICPALKLIKPDVKPWIRDIEFPDGVKEMLSGMKRKRIVEIDDDTPDAA